MECRFVLANGEELIQSLDWIYAQTPQFTVSSHPFEHDDRERPPLPKELPSSVRSALLNCLNIPYARIEQKNLKV